MPPDLNLIKSWVYCVRVASAVVIKIWFEEDANWKFQSVSSERGFLTPPADMLKRSYGQKRLISSTY